jgi:PAS domain-containing protein
MAGLSDKEIARELGLALDTVRTYWQRIRVKVGGGTRAEIITLMARADVKRQMDEQFSENQRLTDQIELRKKSEEKLTQAHMLAKMGSWEWEPDNPHTQWSESLYRLFGLDPRVPAPSPDAYISQIHPDDRDLVRSSFDKLISKGIGYDLNYRVRTGLGEEIVVHSINQPELNEEGKTIRVYGTIQDITAQAMVEHRLRTSQTRLRDKERLMAGILRLLPKTPVVFKRADRSVRYVGANIEPLLGYRPVDLQGIQGQGLNPIFRPEDRSLVECACKELDCAPDGEWRSFSVRLLHRDGAEVPAIIEITVYERDDQNRTSELLALIEKPPIQSSA